MGSICGFSVGRLNLIQRKNMGKSGWGREKYREQSCPDSSVAFLGITRPGTPLRKGQLEVCEELAREEGQWRSWPGVSPARARGCLCHQ